MNTRNGDVFSALFRDESCSVVFETDATPGTVSDVGGGIETDIEEMAGINGIIIMYV